MCMISLRDIKTKPNPTKKSFSRKVISLREVHKLMKMKEDNTWDFFMQMGFIDGNVIVERDYENINLALKDKPVAVIGSSLSGRKLNWKNLRNIHTIGINHIIEIYNNLDYLIFQDHRFLRLNKYDLKKFKGKIFVANSNPAFKRFGFSNIYPFVPISLKREPSKRIQKGLYARKSTGLCAVNLALIMGANPIFLIGLDNEKDWEEKIDYKKGIHITQNYKGTVNTFEAVKGYLVVLEYFKKFLPYKNRIINVCKNGIMDWFNQISIEEFNLITNQNLKEDYQ